jgi:hypothetical protein
MTKRKILKQTWVSGKQVYTGGGIRITIRQNKDQNDYLLKKLLKCGKKTT